MLIGRALRMLPRRHNEARKVVGCTSTVEPRSHRRAAIAPEAALRSQHVTFEGTSDGPTRCHSAQSADRHSWMSACADDPWSATRERIGRTALTGRCRRRESIRSNRVRGPIRCSRWTRPNRCSRSTARSPSIRSTKSIRSSATTGTTWWPLLCHQSMLPTGQQWRVPSRTNTQPPNANATPSWAPLEPTHTLRDLRFLDQHPSGHAYRVPLSPGPPRFP